MSHLLYYYFFNDVIKSIEPKYYNIIEPALDKSFLYANFIEITAYYNLLSLNKKKNYHIYERLHNEKAHEALDYLKKSTIQHHYDEYHLLFLMAFITSKILSNYLDGFLSLTNQKAKQLKFLEVHQYLHKTNGKTYHKFNMVKFFEKSLTLTDKDQEIIEKLLSDVFYFSYGYQHFQISLKKFKIIKQKYQKDFLGLKRLYLLTISKLKKDKRIKFLLINPKNKGDFLNENKNHWQYHNAIDKNLTFAEMYQEALTEASRLINLICDEIFYNKTIKKGLNMFF